MELDAESDEALMWRYGGGNAAAFDVLYARHEMRIWRYIQGHVGNQATADELMQDVWFAVAREAGRYRPTARFTTWLFTLAHHRVIDAFRARRDHASLDEPGDNGETLLDELPAEDGDPLPELQSAQDQRALLSAIAQLPVAQRDTFLLQVEGDMSVQEIAAATGVSFETTKSRLRYARHQLRQLLREYA